MKKLPGDDLGGSTGSGRYTPAPTVASKRVKWGAYALGAVIVVIVLIAVFAS